MTLFPAAESQTLDVRDLSGVGEARRLAADLAFNLGFSETQRGNLAIIVTEAATNLAQHAQDGRLLLQVLRQDDVDWIEVLALDKGPGMPDVQRCMQDGYSTAGTAGQGLGAIRRLADFFDLYSMPGIGTALLARVCSKPNNRPCATDTSPPPLLVSAVNMPMPGERFSGDSWAASLQSDRSLLMVVDGLGHGPQASEAAVEARRVFLENRSRELLDIFDAAHGALRKTRGAAMAITEVRIDHRIVRFAGVGNIAGVVWSPPNSRSMVSHNGIVGHELRKLQDFTYPFPQGSLIMMYSDGLTSHCNFNAYPGLLPRHPALMAAMLYRDCARGRDDATILVAREP